MNQNLNSLFQNILGRDPTAPELEYFNKFLSSGELQAQEIGQILQSSPEFQQTQLDRNAAAYGERLNAQNEAILGQAGAAATSRFAGLGRPNTSAIGASILQAGGQLAQQRQSALADFYGRGMQTNAANQFGMGQNALNRGYGLRDESRRRAWDIEDYYRQKNDYESARQGQSGWNAITPEFAINTAIGTAGKIGSAYAGGYGAGRGSSGRGLF